MCTEMPARKPVVTGVDNKIRDPAQPTQAANSEDRANQQRQSHGVRLIVGRAGCGQRNQSAGKNRRDGGIGAAGQEAVAAERGKSQRSRDEGEKADLRREAAEPGGRHLFGDGDRSQRQARDQIGRQITRPVRRQGAKHRPIGFRGYIFGHQFRAHMKDPGNTQPSRRQKPATRDGYSARGLGDPVPDGGPTAASRSSMSDLGQWSD
jgi:hypothetical protein